MEPYGIIIEKSKEQTGLSLGSSAMQPCQLCSCNSSGCAAKAEEAVYLSGSSSSADAAQRHQRRSNLQQHRFRQPCSLAALNNSLEAVQIQSTALQPCRFNPQSCSFNQQQRSFTQQPWQPCSFNQQRCSHAALFNCLAAVQPNQQPCICIRL